MVSLFGEWRLNVSFCVADWATSLEVLFERIGNDFTGLNALC